MSYLGIDLHPYNFVVCKMEANEQITSRATYSVTPEGLAEFKKTLSPEDQIAVEATTNSSWFVRQIGDYVAKVIVVNTRQFKVLTKSVKKTDKNDAQLLAYYLLKDMLPACRMKTPEQEDLKAVSMARDQHVSARTSCLNKINNIFIRSGCPLKNVNLKSKKVLEALDFSSFSRTQQVILESMRKEIIHLNGLIYDLEKEIEELSSIQKGYDELKSISGVGTITIAIVLSTVGNINDFDNVKQLLSYLGVVPGVIQSSSSIRYGRITKKGCPLTRKLLVQCALQVIKESPEFAQFYYRMKQMKGSGRAIIATARKLIEVMYDVLKTGKIYTNFAKNEYYIPA